MNPIFKRVFALLPKQYITRAYIAGGAAADLDKASDIDLFVLGINEQYKADNFERDLKKADIPGIKFRGDDDEPTHKKTDSAVDGHFNVIADVDGGALGLPIQIITSPFLTIEDLLYDFDLSTHCVAYSQAGVLHTIPDTTTITESPKVVHSNLPDHTISRYRRLCLRYGVAPDPDELVKLCLMPDIEKA